MFSKPGTKLQNVNEELNSDPSLKTWFNFQIKNLQNDAAHLRIQLAIKNI